ncbi:serine protease 41 isoform 4 precursor [Homo sapiens]|uniref:serine protease 41 isoform 4 precursor n=1 Tax=Homo sapiens TaxID=9606 RepID=UPI001C403EF5|nr:serine protease 41 isoform 4 precursor [Homo sapiens]
MGARGALLLALLLARAGLGKPESQEEELLSEACGHREIHALVAGGVESARGRWPWQASLRLRRRHRCGGSLLSRRWVLSAAHCFQKHYYPSEWTVQLGELTSRPTPWNLRAYSSRYKVQDIIVNPDALGVLRNDIALLRLASSVTYNAYIQPICIESSTFNFVHRPDCWVTGWGLISPSGSEAGDRPGGVMGVRGEHYPLPLFPLHKHSSPLLGLGLQPAPLLLSFSPHLLFCSHCHLSGQGPNTQFFPLPGTVGASRTV